MSQKCLKTTCPYCGVGCGVRVDGQGIVGDETHPANEGALCVKGVALADSLAMPSRLLYPKLNGQEVSWQQATSLIAQKMVQAKRSAGADSVAMYVSGQLLTEDYYVANKLMKGFVGSANIDTNSRLCMSSAVAAHIRAFGEDVVPVNYDDIDETDLLVICGANTAWTHPVLFRRIQQARERNPQLKLVVIDPRKTVTAQQADLHLAIANDGDVALFNGLLRHLVQKKQLDHDYIAAHTEGFDALMQQLSDLTLPLPALARELGVADEALQTFFNWFGRSDKAITLFCQGVNQAPNGVDKGNAIINAHLASGKIGRAGAGPFSITGQPNAMGGREVGGLANQLAVHRGFDDESIDRVQRFWQAPAIATKPGLKAVDLFAAAERGDIDVLWIMATNPVVSMPNNSQIKRALARCPFVIVSDITGDSDIAQYADLVLPAAGWGEKQGMVTNSERRLSRQRRFQTPPGEAKPDWWAITQVGQQLCELDSVANGFNFASEVEVFREYAAMTAINSDSPLLLDLSQYASLSAQEYDQWQPTQWGGERPFADGRFAHASGRAKFICCAPNFNHSQTVVSSNDESHSAAPLWWLNTGRQRDQWHTMTRTGHITQLAAGEVEPTVYMNSLAASEAGLKAGQLVALNVPQHRLSDNVNDATFSPSQAQGSSVLAKVAFDDGLGQRHLFMSMHWAGVYGGESQVNAVVAATVDPISGQPAFKSSYVTVSPAPVVAYGLYVGSQFDPSAFFYHTQQSETGMAVWRFASHQPITRQSFTLTPHTQRLTLATSTGWLAVDYETKGSQRVIRALMVVSEQPTRCDYTTLVKWIGQPLDINPLLAATQNQTQAKLVCSCFRITDKQIIDAVEKHDCRSVAQVQNRLKCGTNCGSCLSQIHQMVEEQVASSALTTSAKEG
ncbi:nitrate reductase [Vibrio sp. SM6]|uniref:Nitrate reductase n=1 Tax=Vibrio agarilyticus TaxID=2726741 RepID=A0A7X8TTP5_9VIBR|nr:nitrate reductase [Vibrio agarilyticus]NLS14720.1 nitrate reductase [Vibrio agarilyticus]